MRREPLTNANEPHLQDEVLSQRILRVMRAKRQPMAGGQIATALQHDARAVRQALLWLMDAGKVWTTEDGCRYVVIGGSGPTGGGVAA